MRALVTIVAIVFGALVFLGYLGAWHPAGDSFAVFRVPLAAVFALLVIWSPWPRWLRWPLAAAALVALAQVAAQRLDVYGEPSDQDFTLYQQNLLFSRKEDAQWLGIVAENAPDMITLQEVSARNKTLLSALAASHPYQQYCDFGTVGGVAVLSRFPAVPGSGFCAGRNGLAAIQVETDHGPVWLVSVHLHWPWPYGQAAQVDRLLPVLAQLEGHIIIGGDFNAVGWSHSVARIARAIDGDRVHHSGATFYLPLIGMPVTIDHVLTSPAFSQAARSMPKAGSDHHGVLAYLTRPQRR